MSDLRERELLAALKAAKGHAEYRLNEEEDDPQVVLEQLLDRLEEMIDGEY